MQYSDSAELMVLEDAELLSDLDAIPTLIGMVEKLDNHPDAQAAIEAGVTIEAYRNCISDRLQELASGNPDYLSPHPEDMKLFVYTYLCVKLIRRLNSHGTQQAILSLLERTPNAFTSLLYLKAEL